MNEIHLQIRIGNEQLGSSATLLTLNEYLAIASSPRAITTVGDQIARGRNTEMQTLNCTVRLTLLIIMEVENMSNRNNKEIYDDDDVVQLPGFRFHPTDEELVSFYLRRKIEKKPIRIELIKQADIYKYDPWDLPKSTNVGEKDKEWYFFCKRGRKYKNSIRPNRVTGSGFWKATGIDRPIYDSASSGRDCIGLKKSLVYYRGAAGKGTKTDWMMHEFRLPATHDVKTTKHLDDKIIAQEALILSVSLFKRYKWWFITPSAHVAYGNPGNFSNNNRGVRFFEAEVVEVVMEEVWTLCRILKRNVSYRKCVPDWREVSDKKINYIINPIVDHHASSQTCSLEYSSDHNGQTSSYISFSAPIVNQNEIKNLYNSGQYPESYNNTANQHEFPGHFVSLTSQAPPASSF
ncbi:hypothetical protein DH2020_017046 [Rehmannia glutinosa]|uniref:NAC domain-containing protein n=1 Tax=Rehmannia glutinosa TaxID=99300 RepID=A0ABR0WSC9_REHGL